MFLIKALLAVLPIGLTFGNHTTNSFTSNDICYEPYDDFINDVDYTMSLTSCSAVCARDECCSFMYNAESQRCITSSLYARNVTQGECGWKYMVNQNKCDAPGLYTPYAAYTCDHGYSFKPADNKCLPYCDTYGSTFGKFENYQLYHLNQKTISHEENVSSSEQELICLEVCLNITDFICRTMEIDPFWHVCHFSNETALSSTSAYRYLEGRTLYHRNCA